MVRIAEGRAGGPWVLVPILVQTAAIPILSDASPHLEGSTLLQDELEAMFFAVSQNAEGDRLPDLATIDDGKIPFTIVDAHAVHHRNHIEAL